MSAARWCIRLLDGLLRLGMMGLMLTALIYAAYALWDNEQVYEMAENVRLEMAELKPEESDAQGPGFEELQKINPDVCGWLTLEGTGVDYPVLQGESNLSYINTDVYGNFALAGSIFLDSRCSRGFEDGYSLLYGHHMDTGQMFGDLDLYEDEAFFAEHKDGVLMTPEGSFRLEIFACMLIPASEDNIFEVTKWKWGYKECLTWIGENAMQKREEILEELLADNGKILAMSTCSEAFSDARTIVLAKMTEGGKEIEQADSHDPAGG